MAYRVAQWNPGGVDRPTLRGIIQSSAVELVGLGVGGRENVGLDAGTLAGTAATGVVAATDLDELLALIPDCVHYAAPHDQDLDGLGRDLIRILKSGASVVTHTIPAPPSSESFFDVLRAAADEGAATLYTTGTSMGVADALLPLVLASATQRLEGIRLIEMYEDAQDAAGLGLGNSASDLPPLLRTGALVSTWAPTLHTMARGLGVALDDVEAQAERAEEHGAVVAVRFEVRGVVAATPRLVVEHVARLRPDTAPDWPACTGPEGYRIVIEGEPRIVTDVALVSAEANGGRAAARAMALVNAMPAVCRARPGLLTVLDLQPSRPTVSAG